VGLEQWLDALTQLPDHGTAYLPFDFSDQGTGWLVCQRRAQEVEIALGWATLEGWTVMPSALGDLSTMPTGLQVDGSTIRTTVTALADAFHHSRSLVG
jgi:hypothetical protein